MKALRFLITAGPTREYIDPIRYISNRSSGKMGYALATAARQVSKQVVLVSGPTALTPPAKVEFVPVTTAQEMADAVFERVHECDVVIMAAAVCDFRPRQTAPSKLKKQTMGKQLELEPTMDILAELGRREPRPFIMGFALETDDLEANAREKLLRKRADLIVANDARAFDADTNAVLVLSRAGGRERLPTMSKAAVAEALIQRILRERT